MVVKAGDEDKGITFEVYDIDLLYFSAGTDSTCGLHVQISNPNTTICCHISLSRRIA